MPAPDRDFKDKQGPSIVETQSAILWRRYSMTRMVLAPCSPFTVTKDLMIKAAQLARKHEGVRLHTHMAENQVPVPPIPLTSLSKIAFHCLLLLRDICFCPRLTEDAAFTSTNPESVSKALLCFLQ